MARKNQKQKNKLLEELAENPLISRACSKLKIHRSTFYRWRDDDLTFKADAAVAIERGRDKISDFAEAKLYENVSNNNQQAIAFVLRHNSRRYRPHAIRLYLDENKKQEQELKIIKAILDELIDNIGIDEAMRIAGHDPVEFKKRVRKEIWPQDNALDEL